MSLLQEIKQRQDQILAQWAAILLQRQREQLAKTRAKASGNLSESIQTKVQKSDLQLVGGIIMSFHRYGRFIDMRKVDRTEQLPVQAIEDWIRARGVGKFTGRLKRYRPGLKTDDRSQLINQIAWGIVKGKQKRKKHKPRRWYNKYKERTFFDLRDALADLYMEMGVKSATDALKQNSKITRTK